MISLNNLFNHDSSEDLPQTTVAAPALDFPTWVAQELHVERLTHQGLGVWQQPLAPEAWPLRSYFLNVKDRCSLVMPTSIIFYCSSGNHRVVKICKVG